MKTSIRKTIESVNGQFVVLIQKLPGSAFMALAVLVFGALGTWLLVGTHAATPTANFEAEAGTRSGNASVLTDAAASGGSAVKFTTASSASWPDDTNTGTPANVTLHSCPLNISSAGNYDSCNFAGDLTITNVCKNTVIITRSKINGQVQVKGPGGYDYTPGNLSPNAACDATGATISDTTIDCGCMSQGANDTPEAVSGVNFTLLRVNLFNAGHGVTPDEFVTIQDSYIHGLGGNTDAHKDGIFISEGDHYLIKHNVVECNDGPSMGCTSAIGILSDFSDVTYATFDGNLLNTIGAYCFYGSGGPQKPYRTYHTSFINNHFGRKFNPNCAFYGPVTYFDVNATGNVWSGNVWDDTGAPVPAEY